MTVEGDEGDSDEDEEGDEERVDSVELPVGTDVGADEDESVVVVAEFGTCTNSERQTPKPGTTFDDPVQFADTHDPARRTCVGSEHAKQLLEPGPEQLEQLESQFLHVELVRSKNWDWAHVGKQRLDVRTGRVGKHVKHWLKEGPEQLAQSG